MANLARQLREGHKVSQQQKVQVKSNKAVKKSLFSPGEKILVFIFGAFVCFGSVHIISNQAAIYEQNKEIQDTNTMIQEQKKVNSDLTIQVSELSQYERIREKAKELGLELNDNNVKVVQE